MKRNPTNARLAELFELEEDAYRLATREANLLNGSPPASSLRAVVAHANETLDTLPSLARKRGGKVGSASALVVDTLHRLRDVVMMRVVDNEHGYRRVLDVLRKGIDVVHLLEAGARQDGDIPLATWCRRWLEARESLVAGATAELEWLARHPYWSRVALGAAIPTTP
jgi:hypothetical protein